MQSALAPALRGACGIASGVVLGAVWGYFGYRQLLAFVDTGQWSYFAFGFTEILIAAFFMFRTRARSVSSNPFDWAVAFIGLFAPSFFSPASYAVFEHAYVVMYVGMALQVLGVLSLNRSLAIVPARREIKTGGMYRVVRHPLYTSHIVALGGYVLMNTSAYNLTVYAVAVLALLIRIFREEKLLSADPAYRTYMSEVRYRLLPMVF